MTAKKQRIITLFIHINTVGNGKIVLNGAHHSPNSCIKSIIRSRIIQINPNSSNASLIKISKSILPICLQGMSSFNKPRKINSHITPIKEHDNFFIRNRPIKENNIINITIPGNSCIGLGPPNINIAINATFNSSSSNRRV